MEYRPIWMPDTSTVNSLTDDSEGEYLISGLSSAYFVRFPFTVVSEIIATTSGVRRKQLLRVCRRLLRAAGDCIEPHHEIIRAMVAEFERSGRVDSTQINLRMEEAEKEIFREENFDDALSASEREEGRTYDKTFVGVYGNAKPAFDNLAASGVLMPGSVAELVTQLQHGGAFWNLAKNLCDRVATRSFEIATVKRFYDACEPLRALMIALVAAQFDRCVRDQNSGPSLRAGRNDTFMATCLPYCDEFVTNDPKQLACYRVVASLVGFDVRIRSYNEFRDSFSLSARAAG
jgi:hypothetical protein